MTSIAHGLLLANAQQGCTHCMGLGHIIAQGRYRERVCACVWRAVWRICFARFRAIRSLECYVTTGTSQPRESRAQNKPNSDRQRINEEYSADFILLAKRALRGDDRAWRLFRFHFLLGAEWNICAPRLGLNRGEFFHEVYRVQQRIGRAFAETLPYGIFPLDEYFGGTFRGTAKPVSIDPDPTGTAALSTAGAGSALESAGRDGLPLRAPLRSSALLRSAA